MKAIEELEPLEKKAMEEPEPPAIRWQDRVQGKHEKLESPKVTGSGAAATQYAAQTAKANNNKDEDQQPISREDGGVAIGDLGKGKSFDFVEVIICWHAINVERGKVCDIHRVRENRGPPGSPDRDVSGVII